MYTYTTKGTISLLVLLVFVMEIFQRTLSFSTPLSYFLAKRVQRYNHFKHPPNIFAIIFQNNENFRVCLQNTHRYRHGYVVLVTVIQEAVLLRFR